jgi:hypothetical protein
MEDLTPTLQEVVTKDTELKEWLVNFVGDTHNPENGEVTVAMIVDTVAQQFPEFLMAVAEENWVRGYHQALDDVDAGRDAIEQENV